MKLIDTDTVYRQDAIEALKNAELLVRNFGYYKAIEAIRQLPYAQSEIIRCKDCIHFPNPNADYPMTGWSRDENDYCSYAERKEKKNEN